MFQSIFGRTFCKNVPIILSAKCSTTTGIRLKKEINRVSLVGTVVETQAKEKREKKFILVKTTAGNSQKDQVHHVFTTVPFDFNNGQRVFVGGKLSSKKVITTENKTVNQPIIQAFQIYPLSSKNNATSAANETNSVELMTNVCADVINKDNHSILQVVTHYENKSTSETLANFHAIFVFDADLRNTLCKNVKKNDRIFVNGFLSGNTHTFQDGKRLKSGFIVAEHIDKITRFAPG